MESVGVATSVILSAILASWMLVAFVLTVSALRRSRNAKATAEHSAVQEALLAAGPALSMIVLPGGGVDASQRLVDLLGVDTAPALLSDLLAAAPREFAQLSDAVAACARSGRGFSLSVRLASNGRTLVVHGGPAPFPLPSAAVLVWFVDMTDVTAETLALTQERDDVGAALGALTRMIEAAPFPMWHRGPDLGLALVNAAYVRAVDGADARSVVAGGVELVEASDSTEARAAAEKARQTDRPVLRTLPATVGGERRILQITDVPLGDEHGGVAGYAIDVSEREQAKADLDRFADAQRAMLDRLSSGVAQFAPDRALIFSNRPFARLFDMTAEWLADGPEFDRVLERMRENHLLPEVRDFPEWKAERRAWFSGLTEAIEEAWLLPGGAHIRVVAQPLPDGGLLLIFEDRTEQVQLASARDTLLRVRTATLENLFEAIGVFAGDGRLYLWNNRFREIWGLEEEQLASHPRVDELVPRLARLLSRPEHAGLVRELVRSATSERQQRGGRVQFADGRHFEFAAVPLPDGNALFTMLDVTDSRRIETALRERTEALEEADRVKTAFVAGMSYELRTPLTSIAGFAEMLAGGYGGVLEPAAGEYVGAILQATDRLGKLIDDVLDLTQNEAGGGLVRTVPVDLRALCTEAGESFAAAVAEAGIELVMRVEDGLGTIDGDPRRLREALRHLLGNACRHTGAGGRILLHGEGNRRGAVITVSDNGSGIAPDDQARVFDRFHRVAGGGTMSVGLGLPLTRQFVEAHGGTVELLSEPGVGTSVTIRLPRTAPK